MKLVNLKKQEILQLLDIIGMDTGRNEDTSAKNITHLKELGLLSGSEELFLTGAAVDMLSIQTPWDKNFLLNNNRNRFRRM